MWKGYEALRNGDQDKFGDKVIADISQTPTTSFRVISANMPTLCTKSDLVNLKRGRVLHPYEYFHALNIPIFDSEAECVIHAVAERLTRTEIMHLSGNGMNLAQVGSILMFALAASSFK